MLEIHDELMTPGCPQCAVKHLSAALYYTARHNMLTPEGWRVKAAVAEINLVEVLNGYKSHLWYAVGALAVAEEQAVVACDRRDGIREARLIIEERGLPGAAEALYALVGRGGIRDCDRALAHYEEAKRELPAMADQMLMHDLVGSIERIREEFFPSDTSAPAAVTAEGGGESEMAKKTTKKPQVAKPSGSAKAVQAACKGGKCKK